MSNTATHFARRSILLILLLGSSALVARLWVQRSSPSGFTRNSYENAMLELRRATDSRSRYYALRKAALTSVYFGTLNDARTYATELLQHANDRSPDWNYGNAIHDGHVVLGLVAVRLGDLRLAEGELLLAAETPGSPQLATFGPNLLLAKELLDHGSTATVQTYLSRCMRFWTSGKERLDHWLSELDLGSTPDFGDALVN